MSNESSPQSDKLGFEVETCSRCGGSGHYSYNQISGTVCFKCGGAKRVYTKRGKAARDYMTGLRSRRVDSLKVGDLVWIPKCFFGTFKGQYAAIQSITPYDSSGNKSFVGGVEIPQRTECLVLKFEVSTSKGVSGYADSNVSPEEMKRVKLTPEEERSTLEAALAYQATLTKTGTPRKR